MHTYTNYYEKNGYKIIECLDCGFKHLYPYPTQEELTHFYTHFYDKNMKRYNMVEKYEIIVNNFNVRKRVLDIGCFDGQFLKIFKEHGWEVMGIEPAAQANQFADALGINIINDTFENINNETLGKFGVINLQFVLEHVIDPISVCKRVFDILEPGGICCIEVPNDFNIFQEIIHKYLGKEMWWIALPDHINYFSFESLERMLKTIGFEIAYKMATFPMEVFVLFGDDYIGKNDIGSQVHQKRLNFEKALIESGNIQLKNELYTRLAEMGLGRTAIIFARKPV